MRPSLLRPLRQRSRKRPERRSHERRTQQRRNEPRVIVIEERASGCAHGCDPAVDRVRSAGGPLDVAVYTCCCGYLFSAAVSTTVRCPHCGTDQAW